MDSPPMSARTVAIGMIAATGSASIGEGKDRLAPGHEGVGLGDVAAGGSPLDLLAATGVEHDATGPARDFGDSNRAEMPDQLIQRTRDRGHRTKLLDEVLTGLDSGLAKHRLSTPEQIYASWPE